MKALLLRYSRPIAACLIFMVAAQTSEAAALPLAQAQADPAQQTTQNSQTQGALPDAPQAPDPAPQQAQEQPAPGFASRSQDAQQPGAQQSGSQQPVGTAAGPATNPSGVAGSRPAGAAIAPAKQRRVKAILIRVSLIVAGAAAAGAVIGLSKGSSSRP